MGSESSASSANRIEFNVSQASQQIVISLYQAGTESPLKQSADTLVSKVFDDCGVQCAATGGFRMSPHVYNNVDHVDRVIAALKRNRALLG